MRGNEEAQGCAVAALIVKRIHAYNAESISQMPVIDDIDVNSG